MSEQTYSEQSFDALWRLDDAAESEMDLRALNLKIKATGNPYLLAHLLSRVATTQLYQNHLEQALETLNEADYVLIEAAKRDTSESAHKHRAWLRYLIERARFFSRTGWETSALTMLRDAREMAHGTGHLDLVKEIHAFLQELEASPG